MGKDLHKQIFDVAVRALRASRRQNQQGQYVLNYSSNDFHFDDMSSMLLSATDFHNDVCPIDRQIIISKAQFEAIKHDNFDSELLRRCIVEEEKRLRKTPWQDFVVATHVSIQWSSAWLQHRRINHSRISFHSELPRRFSREPLTSVFQYRDINWLPENWKAVIIRTSARNPAEALWRGRNDFTILRAIWNFFENRSLRRTYNEERPINQIVAGPVFTVHKTSGEVDRMFDFDHTLKGSIDNVPHNSFRQDKITRLARFERIAREQIKKFYDPNYLTDLLNKYVAALDKCDHSESFLALWSLLEDLTCASANGKTSHDAVVKCGAFIFQDRDNAELILEHLRRVRNKCVHERVVHEDITNCMCQLMRMVHSLLRFYFRTAGKIANASQMRELLELPTSPNRLKEEIKLRKMALRIHSNTKGTSDGQ